MNRLKRYLDMNMELSRLAHTNPSCKKALEYVRSELAKYSQEEKKEVYLTMEAVG